MDGLGPCDTLQDSNRSLNLSVPQAGGSKKSPCIFTAGRADRSKRLGDVLACGQL